MVAISEELQIKRLNVTVLNLRNRVNYLLGVLEDVASAAESENLDEIRDLIEDAL